MYANKKRPRFYNYFVGRVILPDLFSFSDELVEYQKPSKGGKERKEPTVPCNPPFNDRSSPSKGGGKGEP